MRVLQVGLAAFRLGALGFADGECAATQVFGFVGFVFCQSNLLEGDFLFYRDPGAPACVDFKLDVPSSCAGSDILAPKERVGGFRRDLDGPSDASTEIGVGEEFRHRLIARESDESDLEAGSPGVLHGWDAVGVVGCQCDQIDRTIG